MIKRYNEFVGGKVNEELEMGNFEETPIIEEPVTDDDTSEVDSTEAELPEEEGGEYQGQILLNQLADELGTEVGTDGSINYEGKKINFYSETEKFHVDNKKFSTAEEVINYLGSTTMSSNDEDEMTDEIEGERKVGLDEVEDFEDDAFESKSYKHTRKFESFRKNK